MKMKRASLFCTLALILCFFPVASSAEEDPLEERIEHLEEHLFVVDAQLGKLELIRKSLEQMREDDLTRLRKLMWPGNKKLRSITTDKPKADGANKKSRLPPKYRRPLFRSSTTTPHLPSELQRLKG